MIRHQNALAMFLASVLMRGFHPLNVCRFKYFQGVNAPQTHWLGTWRQHCKGYPKIIAKPSVKSSGFEHKTLLRE
jgi:hypothetical protein